MTGRMKGDFKDQSKEAKKNISDICAARRSKQISKNIREAREKK